MGLTQVHTFRRPDQEESDSDSDDENQTVENTAITSTPPEAQTSKEGSSDDTALMIMVGFGSSLCCVILFVVGVAMMSRMRSQ